MQEDESKEELEKKNDDDKLLLHSIHHKKIINLPGVTDIVLCEQLVSLPSSTLGIYVSGIIASCGIEIRLT